MLPICKSSESVFKRQYRRQFLGTICTTLLMFGFGYILGWLVIILPKLQSPTDTTLAFVLSLNDGSWMASLFCLGGGCGNIVFGSLADRIGRKACLYALAIPFITSWIVIYFATSVGCLLASRFVAGFSNGGSFVIIPLYIAEISDPKIRGSLGSYFVLACYTGSIFGYILTPHLSYHCLAVIGAALAVIYLILQIIFPETPMYLLKCGFESLAMDSLKFYRNYDTAKGDTLEEFKTEFDNMKNAIASHRKNAENVTWQDFFNRRAAKAFGNGVVLMLINVFSGTSAMLYYTPSIFSATRTALDPNSNTLIMGFIQVGGVYTATILIDLFGRKPLMIFSSIATSLGMAIFGLYGFLLEHTSVDMSGISSWLPIVNVGFVMFVVNVGLMPLPFMLLVELMPPTIRAKATAICLVIYNILNFILLKIFPIYFDTFGLAPPMWIFACVCLFGAIYVACFIRETKGMSINENP